MRGRRAGILIVCMREGGAGERDFFKEWNRKEDDGIFFSIAIGYLNYMEREGLDAAKTQSIQISKKFLYQNLVMFFKVVYYNLYYSIEKLPDA